jgi:hypothetical protein
MAGIIDSARKTLAENFGANVGGGNAAAKESEKFTLDETPDLSGKVAVVTGGSEVRLALCKCISVSPLTDLHVSRESII